MTADAALQTLLDRAAVHEVLLRYARGVDRRDIDLVASCFTPEAAYDGALARGDIRQALARLREAMDRYASTMHFLGNMVIEVTGDHASSETYAIAYHRPRAGERQHVVAVRYLDELVRRDGRWLIARRRVCRDWERYDTLTTTEPSDG
jgi:3-phenylpropionate/cinnamic acid dioxygenase small subunit